MDAGPNGFGSLVVGLRRYALGLTGDLEQADDLVQDALARAHDSTERAAETDPRLRLYGILVDRHRARPRPWLRCPILTRGLRRERRPSGGGVLGRWREVGQALDLVDDDERRALLLVVLEGFSYRDVARIEGVAPETVASRISGARAKLSARLHSDTGFPANDYRRENDKAAIVPERTADMAQRAQ